MILVFYRSSYDFIDMFNSTEHEHEHDIIILALYTSIKSALYESDKRLPYLIKIKQIQLKNLQ